MALPLEEIERYLFPDHRNKNRRNHWKYLKRSRHRLIRRSTKKALYKKEPHLIILDKKRIGWEY